MQWKLARIAAVQTTILRSHIIITAKFTRQAAILLVNTKTMSVFLPQAFNKSVALSLGEATFKF